jgi:hypothetical protein
MIAHRVAAPVLEHLGARGVVAGVVTTAAYLDFDGFVVAVTARDVPLMPNGVGITDRPGGATSAWPAIGTAVRLTPAGVSADGWRVAWSADEPPVWDPSVPRANGYARERIRARGEAILRGAPPTPDAFAGVEIAHEPAGREAIAALLAAVESGDAEPAGDAARGLLGRGPGLTPEGDDLLAGAAAAVAALAAGAGWDASRIAAWLAAIVPPDARLRTTPLSATLLELAARGLAVEPLHGLLDLGDERWPAALARLARLGHSTGPCYAAAVGATAALLGQTMRRAGSLSRLLDAAPPRRHPGT